MGGRGSGRASGRRGDRVAVACGTPSTMRTTPQMMAAQPHTSRTRSGSFRNHVAKTALHSTPTDPTGVTTSAGAKPYAMRLPTSPMTFSTMPVHQRGTRMYGFRCRLFTSSQLRLCANFVTKSEKATTQSATIERMTPVMMGRRSMPPEPRPAWGHSSPPSGIARARWPRAPRRGLCSSARRALGEGGAQVPVLRPPEQP